MAAEQDGEILILHGTALGLDHYDDGRLGRRIEAGKVVAAVAPFLQEQRPSPRWPTFRRRGQ